MISHLRNDSKYALDVNKNYPLRPRWWFGGVSSLCVACLVAPLDLIKTHMQTHRQKLSMLDTARNVVKLRGYMGFYDGFAAAGSRQMFSTSWKFSIYEMGKQYDLNHNDLMVKIAWASIAGSTAALLTIPLDVISIRMQADMNEIKSKPYKCLVDAYIRITREEGYRALYNGASASLLKSIIGSVGQIAIYDQVKTELHSRFDMPDTMILHFTSSAISSIIDSIITQPFDTLKALMMNKRPGQGPTLRDRLQYLMRFGLLSPYRGLAMTLIRKVPATIAMYLIYEQLRLNVGSQ